MPKTDFKNPAEPAGSKRLCRRDFCMMAACASASLFARSNLVGQGAAGVHFSVGEFDRVRIVRLAEEALSTAPVTLPIKASPNKQGGRLLFFAHDPAAPRPGNQALPEIAANNQVVLLRDMNIRLSGLVAAWRLTGEARYYEAACAQMRAWFLDEKTRMEPTFDAAGVAQGEEDDRVNGLNQTIPLAESARALSFLCASPVLPEADANGVRLWFHALLLWLLNSKKGSIARQAKTLNSICWAVQAAEFARFTRHDGALKECDHLFREGLLRQMSFDGSFPLALHDPDAYAVSMFTLECLSAVCESLSTPFESMWKYTLPDGRGMRSAVAWAAPYLRERSKWPYVADKQFFAFEPLRENALLFAGRAYDEGTYTDLWKTLRPAPVELAAYQPITQPSLWATRPPA